MSISKIAILASGGGTNAEAIIKYFAGHKSIDVALVLTNNPMAHVTRRAETFNIPSVVFSRDEFKDPDKFLARLNDFEITHIVLAGFLWLIPDYLIKAYPDKIVNIHPALLPKYGGKGMYGIRVHEAVKAAAENETGITIHMVNEHYDEGKILFQASCPVETVHTATDIATCVHELEHKHYPAVIEQWIKDSEISR
jgi:phosphoribosylglycinamide formyltransferase-1